jgi:hypothetical protein
MTLALTFKDRQRKVVIPRLMSASNRGDFEAFLKDLRVRYAEFCNEELRAVGQTRLFDPRRYSEMGIDRKPTKPLGPRLAPLEAAGVPTRVGVANAEIIWTYELQTRLQRCEADRALRDQTLAELRAFAERLGPSDQKHQSTHELLDRAVRAAALLDVVEPDLAEYEVTLAMARARPAKTLDTCSRILKEIEAGRGSTTDRRSRGRIQERLDQAAAFLAGIERIDRANQKIIAEQQPVMDQARRDIVAAADYVAGLEARSPRASQARSTPAFSSSPVIGGDVAPVHGPARSAATAHAPETAVAKSNASGLTEPAAPRPDLSANLEAVIARIKTDRLIVLGPEHHEDEGYRVGGITRDELRVLRDPGIAARVQAELAEIARHQAEEIEGSHLVYRSHGRVRAEEMAANCSGRPSTFENPLGVLLAYRKHPRAAYLMGWEASEPLKSAGKTQSIWRRMRASVADALSRPELSESEIKPEPRATDPAPPSSPIAPRPQNIGSVRCGPSLDEAIAEYAEVIRTDDNVRFVTIDGEQLVDPSSIPDWERSVHAFEDHDLVKAAIRDRWEEEQKREKAAERRRVASETFRAGKMAQILVGLKAGDLIARQGKNGWVIEGRDEDLVFFASQWRDDPQLAAACHKSQARPLPRGPVSQVRHVAPQPPVRRPAFPAPVRSAPQASAATSSPAPNQGYTLSEQQWMRDRQSGQMGR